MNMLAKAISIAADAHLDQVDKGGKPYILHPLHIMHQLAEQGHDEITQAIGVLHDVLEDSDWTVANLNAAGIPTVVTDGLVLMCHNKDEDYFEYIGKMKDNIRVLHVKLEDITHNSLLIRLKGLREKDFARMTKYIKAYALVQQMITNYRSIEAFKDQHLR